MAVDTDRAAAYLAQAQREWEVFGEAAAFPRLAAALTRVLALHELTAYVNRVKPCAQHRDFGYPDSERRACPACTVIERDGCCKRCRDEDGDPARGEDCEIRQAISAALLGETIDG